jgi:phage tail protein X
LATGDLVEITVTRRDDGAAVYTTIDGDTVGNVCCRYYGHEWDTTEAVLAANPGLARRGLVLEAGVKILLPDPPQSSSPGTVNLYD